MAIDIRGDAPPGVNTAFHPDLAGLQLAWDSTSAGEFKRCPRAYQYAIVEGWTTTRMQVHLEFGILIHKGLEIYDHCAVFDGADHDTALDAVMAWAMVATWDSALGRPWTTFHATKNRWTLLRTLVWYLDQFKDESSKVVVLANGKPAVELSFRYELDLAPLDDPSRPFIACGHMDRLVVMGDATYIRDVKTTEKDLSDEYFAQFTPDNQFSWYTMAGKVIYALPIRGIMVDAIQVGAGFNRFMRRMVPRSEDQIAEWYRGLRHMLRQAEVYARDQFWPQNEKACFACGFREICSKSPGARQQWLQSMFKRRVWDPLKTRGER